MLRPDEQEALALAAQRGETAVAIEMMRVLARENRVGELADVIRVFSEGLEINRAPMRAHLARRVPGILTNHYFPNPLGRTWTGGEVPTFDEFIHYTLAHVGWAAPLIDAAQRGSGSELAGAVASLIHQIAHERDSARP